MNIPSIARPSSHAFGYDNRKLSDVSMFFVYRATPIKDLCDGEQCIGRLCSYVGARAVDSNTLQLPVPPARTMCMVGICRLTIYYWARSWHYLSSLCLTSASYWPLSRRPRISSISELPRHVLSWKILTGVIGPIAYQITRTSQTRREMPLALVLLCNSPKAQMAPVYIPMSSYGVPPVVGRRLPG